MELEAQSTNKTALHTYIFTTAINLDREFITEKVIS